jgi:hypothetical protein
MTDSNIHLHPGSDQGRLSAAGLERLLNWMHLAQTPSPPPRLSAEQLSELLAQIAKVNDHAEQTPT